MLELHTILKHIIEAKLLILSNLLLEKTYILEKFGLENQLLRTLLKRQQMIIGSKNSQNSEI